MYKGRCNGTSKGRAGLKIRFANRSIRDLGSKDWFTIKRKWRNPADGGIRIEEMGSGGQVKEHRSARLRFGSMRSIFARLDPRKRPSRTPFCYPPESLPPSTPLHAPASSLYSTEDT